MPAWQIPENQRLRIVAIAVRDERRWLLLVAAPALRDESVTHPGLRLDVLPSRFALELLAQLAYEDAKVLGLMRRLRAPDRCQQDAMRHHFAGVASQVQQQLKFLGVRWTRLPWT